MSVCIALIPVALAMRIVMGKENFENWVASQELRFPTHLKTELDLVRTVKKAGYDAERFGPYIKTHFGKGIAAYMIWERVDGQWTAVFSKYDQPSAIEQFKSNIESITSTPIFIEKNQQTALNTEIPLKFPTNFNDGQLLYKTLSDFGATPTLHKDGTITCKLEQSMLRFTPNQPELPFEIEVKNAPNLEKVYQALSTLDEDYKHCLQTVVYEKLKARAQSQNLSIESEEVLPDKTVVVTLNILKNM